MTSRAAIRRLVLAPSASAQAMVGRARFAIGLDRHAEPVPALERRQTGDRLDDVEAHLEPLGLLGVDGEMDAELRRQRRQRLDLLDQGRARSASYWATS